MVAIVVVDGVEKRKVETNAKLIPKHSFNRFYVPIIHKVEVN
jgi:hypothetical protein